MSQVCKGGSAGQASWSKSCLSPGLCASEHLIYVLQAVVPSTAAPLSVLDPHSVRSTAVAFVAADASRMACARFSLIPISNHRRWAAVSDTGRA